MSETKKTAGANAGSSAVQKAVVVHKTDAERTVSVAGGFVEFRYYESILQDAVKANYLFADSGNSIDKKTVQQGLPMNGGETFQFSAKDNNDTELTIEMIVGKTASVSEENTKQLMFIPLSSKAFAINDTKNVRAMFPKNKISEHIKTLITDYLESEKELDIEETSNAIKEFGLNRRPYYMLNNFSKQAQPSGGEGKTAGYFFFETSDKMIFKSIDSLFDEEKNPRKRSIIFNSTTDKSGTLEGYDYKALTYDKETANKLEMSKLGAFSTCLISIDQGPDLGGFNFKRTILSTIEDIVEDIDEKIEPLKTAAKNLVDFDPKLIKEFGRTSMLFDNTGTFSETTEGSKEKNLDIASVYSQSIMRYNQVFASRVHILVQGDFELHAGDMIFFDGPSPEEDTKNDEVDKESGGLYIIASLCHYITPDRTLTKLTLIRDSTGRQGNHTRR